MPEKTQTKKLKIPEHVAIIADGNRRWAKQYNLPTLEGHRKGAENFENLLKKARDMNIKFITGWFFSTENWKRGKEENEYLFNLARHFARKFTDKFLAEKVRFFHLGRRDRLPDDIVEMLENLEEKTKEFKEFTVCVAMDYGGQDEIIRTVNKLIENGQEITPENIVPNLDTRGIVPAPDFIIRTSGEKRLSGFMSWLSAYSELYFPETYFPDFGPKELEKAIEDFSSRDRRFGGNSK